MDVTELSRELEGFRLKDPNRVRTLAGAIRLTGSLPPIQVAQMGSQRLVVIDGFKRLHAARLAGWDHVPAAVVQMDRAQALALMAQLNSRTQSLSALEEGWIAHELHRSHGRTLEQIALLFARDTSWVCRRRQLVERLDPSVQQLIREGGLDPAAAEELAILPCGKQEPLARRAAQAHLSVSRLRQVVRLILQAPDEPTRRYLTDHPREALELVDAGAGGTRRDPWSRLEAELRVLLSGAGPAPAPDPATRDRLSGLAQKLLNFLIGGKS